MIDGEQDTLDTILEKLRSYKPELQRKYPISNLGVFGSYARGEATENSGHIVCLSEFLLG